ncbi:MAG: hypothetical protein ABI776_06235, partial [Nocardioidaceae bacterium]
MTIRVYVPTTMRGLRSVVTSDGLGPAPFAAHAVTDAVRAELADGGDEEWEYAAASAAGLASVELLRDDDPARRVVVAVDVPSVRVVESDDPTLVEVAEAVPFTCVAAVLADSGAAEADVAAAREAVLAGAAGADRL